MEANFSKAQISFARLLRAFQTGGVCYEDLLTQLDQYLMQGAMRTELLDMLRRRESVEPLADGVYLAVWSRLRRSVHPVADSASVAERPVALMPDAAGH